MDEWRLRLHLLLLLLLPIGRMLPARLLHPHLPQPPWHPVVAERIDESYSAAVALEPYNPPVDSSTDLAAKEGIRPVATRDRAVHTQQQQQQQFRRVVVGTSAAVVAHNIQEVRTEDTRQQEEVPLDTAVEPFLVEAETALVRSLWWCHLVARSFYYSKDYSYPLLLQVVFAVQLVGAVVAPRNHAAMGEGTDNHRAVAVADDDDDDDDNKELRTVGVVPHADPTQETLVEDADNKENVLRHAKAIRVEQILARKVK